MINITITVIIFIIINLAISIIIVGIPTISIVVTTLVAVIIVIFIIIIFIILLLSLPVPLFIVITIDFFSWYSKRHDSSVKTKFTVVAKCAQLMKAFSLYTTLPLLFDTTVRPNQLRGLEAIRFLSMSWVILGHTIVFIAMFGVARK